MKEFNFVHERFKNDSIIQQLFGPLDINNENDNIYFFDDSTKIEHILVKIGFFKSLTEARRNNQSGDITDGWSEIVKRKKGIKVFILNNFDESTNIST